MSELSGFIRDVHFLRYVLTEWTRGHLETDLAARYRFLKAFYWRWVFHENQTGYPTKEKLDALWVAVLEPVWAKGIRKLEEAMSALRAPVRHRSRPIWEKKIGCGPTLQLIGEVQDPDQADQVTALDLAAELEELEEPARSLLVHRLRGCDWNEAAELEGIDQNTMRRTRDQIRKKFEHLRSVS